MKVLIDECVPRALKGFLSKHGHESLTVQEAGWSGKENGELLEAEFDVLVTVDTNKSGPAACFRRRQVLTQLHLGDATWLHRVYPTKIPALQSMGESAPRTKGRK